MSIRSSKLLKKIFIYTNLGIISIVMIFPMFWMLLLSLKKYPEKSSNILYFFTTKFTLENYYDVLMSEDFVIYFINSLIVAGVVTIANIFFCSMSGYALSRKKFLGKKIVSISIITLLIIPSYVIMIPLYKIMLSLNWINSYWSLIVPWLVTPFGVFLLKQYINSLPVQIEDAARIDGASEWYIFFRIVMPLCKPTLIVLAIFTFINNWNSFLFPFIFTSSAEYRTLPVGLTFYLGKQSIDWGLLMTSATISAVPILILFLIFSKRIISSLTAGALK